MEHLEGSRDVEGKIRIDEGKIRIDGALISLWNESQLNCKA